MIEHVLPGDVDFAAMLDSTFIEEVEPITEPSHYDMAKFSASLGIPNAGVSPSYTYTPKEKM
jgi:hypothetical protein